MKSFKGARPSLQRYGFIVPKNIWLQLDGTPTVIIGWDGHLNRGTHIYLQLSPSKTWTIFIWEHLLCLLNGVGSYWCLRHRSTVHRSYIFKCACMDYKHNPPSAVALCRSYPVFSVGWSHFLSGIHQFHLCCIHVPCFIQFLLIRWHYYWWSCGCCVYHQCLFV